MSLATTGITAAEYFGSAGYNVLRARRLAGQDDDPSWMTRGPIGSLNGFFGLEIPSGAIVEWTAQKED